MPPNRASGKGGGKIRGFVPFPLVRLRLGESLGCGWVGVRLGLELRFGASVGLSTRRRLRQNRAPRGTFKRVVLPLI
jgi:hypothetical protein